MVKGIRQIDDNRDLNLTDDQIEGILNKMVELKYEGIPSIQALILAMTDFCSANRMPSDQQPPRKRKGVPVK